MALSLFRLRQYAEPCQQINLSAFQAIQEAQNKLSERTGITQEYVLSNIQKVVERCMQQEAVQARDGSPLLVEGPEGDLACLFEFKETGALKGLELLGKHLGMFKDKIEHDVSDPLKELLSRVSGNTLKPKG